MNPVPQTYEEWERCITVDCGIPLTPNYVTERIKALENRSDYQTQKFIEYWGEPHYSRTLDWFREAKTRVGA